MNKYIVEKSLIATYPNCTQATKHSFELCMYIWDLKCSSWMKFEFAEMFASNSVEGKGKLYRNL